jgi:hypothetical protein
MHDDDILLRILSDQNGCNNCLNFGFLHLSLQITFSDNIEIVREGNMTEQENSQSDEETRNEGGVFNVKTPNTTMDFVSNAGINVTAAVILF